MNPSYLLIIALCAVCGWLAMGFTPAKTVLLLLASGAVLTLIWLAFVLCL